MAGQLFLTPVYYTYILESAEKPGEFYRGHTKDLKQHVTGHNAGKCLHTSKFRPWKVKFYAAFETLELAQAFEKYLKSGSGHAFAKRHLLYRVKQGTKNPPSIAPLSEQRRLFSHRVPDYG
jgi:putative endonuclease